MEHIKEFKNFLSESIVKEVQVCIEKVKGTKGVYYSINSDLYKKGSKIEED